MAEQKKSGSAPRAVREVMTPNPKTVTQTDTIVQAARIMRDQDAGVVPVVDGKKVLGLVTDRDIVVRSIADGKDPNKVRVSEVMSKGIQTVKEDTAVSQALDLMSKSDIRRLPVVNQNGELIGIVSIGDLAAKTNQDDKIGKTVEHISQAAPNN